MSPAGGLLEYYFQLYAHLVNFVTTSSLAVPFWAAWVAMCAGMAAVSLKVFYRTRLKSFRSMGLVYVYCGIGTTLSFASARLFGYPPTDFLGWGPLGLGLVISILGVRYLSLLAFGYRDEPIQEVALPLLKWFAAGVIGSGIILTAGVLLVLIPVRIVIWLVLGCAGAALVVMSYCMVASSHGT